MKKIKFNTGWTCRCITTNGEAKAVSLPHDSMRSEPRTADSAGGRQIGWFAGYDYELKLLTP